MAGIRVRQLAHVCVFARDLEVTRTFYADVLGMETRFNFTRNGRIFGFYLDAGGRTNVEVFENDATGFTERQNINHLCLEVGNLDDAIAHIRAAGVEVTDKHKGCDNTWQAWTADPDGVRIELFEYTEESAQFTGGDREADW